MIKLYVSLPPAPIICGGSFVKGLLSTFSSVRDDMYFYREKSC